MSILPILKHNITACTIALIINPHVVKSGIFEIASIKNTAFALNIAKRGSGIKLLRKHMPK